MCLALINRLPMSNLFIRSLNVPVLARSTRRILSQRSESMRSDAPKCGDRFKNEPCNIGRMSKVKIPQPAPPVVQRDKPEIKLKRSVQCCGDPCPDLIPRFDLLYYRRSDKAKRAYQQTWDECPELFVRPKVICCITPIKPKLKKRPRKDRPTTACKQDVCLQSKTKCPYMKMARCRSGRKPPSCLTERKPAKCVKRKAPFPSFSECKHSPFRAKPSIECKCLSVPSICEVWAYYHKQHAIKKPVPC